MSNGFYIVGNPRCDEYGGYLCHLAVCHQNKNDDLLLNPYETIPLHTDGTFFNGLTDWLLFLKTREENATGGETILMHLADWKEHQVFKCDMLGNTYFTFQGPFQNDTRRGTLGNRSDTREVRKPLFYFKNGHEAFRFIYRWVHPETIAQARFLKDISTSLASYEEKWPVALNLGEGYVVNNSFWLHGRRSFEYSVQLSREVYRAVGTFRTS
jgi:glutarate dioxygenase